MNDPTEAPPLPPAPDAPASSPSSSSTTLLASPPDVAAAAIATPASLPDGLLGSAAIAAGIDPSTVTVRLDAGAGVIPPAPASVTVNETECTQSVREAAQHLYEAYTANSGNLNYQGRQCPAWSDLTSAVRSHWCAVAIAGDAVDAYADGYRRGNRAGVDAGYETGLENGRSEGVVAAATAHDGGFTDGYAEGCKAGYTAGRVDAIAVLDEYDVKLREVGELKLKDLREAKSRILKLG